MLCFQKNAFGAVLLCALISKLGIAGNPPTVATSKGSVSGYYLNNAAVFLKIPYAQPPIGTLRFKNPQPAKAWSGTLNGTQFSPWCMQFAQPGTAFTYSEDCLYLNVFTPRNYGTVNPKLAVMLFIHGGGLTVGSAAQYIPSAIVSNLVSRNVTVVTMNYRLDAFGWFTTYTSIARGNMGMRDMIAAIQWTKNEISYFGGDPTKITIFGESSGAKAVSVLTLSPLSRGLIAQSITESGSAFDPNTVDGYVYTFSKASMATAVAAGCTTQSAWMQGISLVGLYSSSGKFNISNFTKTWFDEFVWTWVPAVGYGSKTSAIVSAIQNSFTPVPPISNSNHTAWLKILFEMSSGPWSAGERKDMGTALVYGNQNVYVYSFDYLSNAYPFPGGFKCVPHAQELFYVFPGMYAALKSKTMANWTWDTYDRMISNKFGQMWTTFAKTGSLKSLGWMPLGNGNTTSTQYYSINVKSKMMKDYHVTAAKVWNNIIPSIMGTLPTSRPQLMSTASPMKTSTAANTKPTTNTQTTPQQTTTVHNGSNRIGFNVMMMIFGFVLIFERFF